MTNKTHTSIDGISYWNTTGDAEDNLIYGIATAADYYRDAISGGAGDDTLHGGGGNDTVEGGDGSDGVYGDSGSDDLSGGSGNDTLDGSGGDDTLNGGSGNDLVAGGDDDDLLVQHDWLGADTFDGGRGVDTLDYSGDVPDGSPPDGSPPIGSPPIGSVHVSLATSSVVKYLDGVARGIDSIRNVDRFIVTAFNDTLDGNAGANMLEGLGGNDALEGGDDNDTLNGDSGATFLSINDTTGGADTLNGGAGSDSLFGGGGDDLFVQDSPFGGDKIDGGFGIDTVDYSQLHNAGIVVNLATGKVNKYANGYLRGIDTLRNIELLIATDLNDTLSGRDGSDSIPGGAGNDRFSMQIAAGNDTLDGGSGSDTLDYNGTPSGAAIVLDLQAGSAAKYLHGQLIGVDTLVDIETFIGSSGADTLTGSDRNDALNGGAGNDLFLQNFEIGNDSFDGGSGTDALSYGQAPDGYAVHASLAAGTVIKYLHGSVIGIDTVRNVEHIGGTGGDDILAGGAGNNRMDGGAGDDRFELDNARGNDTMDGGTGNDTLDYSQFRGGGVAVDFEAGAVAKFSGRTLSGTDTFSGIESFIGTSNNDTLIGNFDGPSVLDARAGIDTLDYSHMNEADRFVEVDLAAGTVKKIDSASGQTRTDFVRNIEIVIGTLYGDTLTGSFENDTLRGGGGNDTINGGDGGDQLSGGSGSDSVSGGDGDDVIVQQALTGNDTINGGSGHDTLDYRMIPDVSISWMFGRVSKYSADHVLLGVDTFTGIETILEVIAFQGPAPNLTN